MLRFIVNKKTGCSSVRPAHVGNTQNLEVRFGRSRTASLERVPEGIDSPHVDNSSFIAFTIETSQPEILIVQKGFQIAPRPANRSEFHRSKADQCCINRTRAMAPCVCAPHRTGIPHRSDQQFPVWDGEIQISNSFSSFR